MLRPPVRPNLNFLRGSAPAYTVAQMPPPLPAFAAPPPLPLAGPPPVLVPQTVTVVRPAVWNWTGFYFGANAGLAVATTNFADPFGASVFGDTVRSPGFMAGGQIGFNWQAPGSRWVLGVEADADPMVERTATAVDGLLQRAGPLAPKIGAVAVDTFWHSLRPRWRRPFVELPPKQIIIELF